MTDFTIYNINNSDLDEKCRICLESGKEELKKRCECNNLCHDSCLINWINERPDTQDKQDMKCEICKTNYIFDNKFKKMLNDEYIPVLWGIVSTCYFIIFQIWLVFFISHLKNYNEKSKFYTLILLLILSVLFSSYLLFILYLRRLSQ